MVEFSKVLAFCYQIAKETMTKHHNFIYPWLKELVPHCFF
ncbi:hypothetical protein BARBAKC583_0997 [Bartonella bacilliformis KC583]|uniref:Uncharacterized protein n=1 Tax=Bartonella bacilliformis (strain ATCC 35685 / KC583 / Herrer 020/F12,63) TaxID=360095 RepID=A1UTH2_BARBK|nr:hypothetical protein BARBAKC583_0997 [Bartonella bacilliformis KC583]